MDIYSLIDQHCDSSKPASQVPDDSRLDNKLAIQSQLNGMVLSMASSIVETHVVAHDGKQVEGRPYQRQVALRCSAGRLNLYLIEDNAQSTAALPTELICEMARHFGILDPSSIALLHCVYSNVNMEHIRTKFVEHGIEVEGEFESVLLLCYAGRETDWSQ